MGVHSPRYPQRRMGWWRRQSSMKGTSVKQLPHPEYMAIKAAEVAKANGFHPRPRPDITDLADARKRERELLVRCVLALVRHQEMYSRLQELEIAAQAKGQA